MRKQAKTDVKKEVRSHPWRFRDVIEGFDYNTKDTSVRRLARSDEYKSRAAEDLEETYIIDINERKKGGN